MTVISSQGATFSFDDSIGHLTAIDVSRSAGTIDVSNLVDNLEGDPRSYEPVQLMDGDEFKIEALYSSGETYPKIGDAGSATFSVGEGISITGDAVCTAVSVKYAVGEVIKLSMTFKCGGTLD
jgi:hypothetical protein